jgi:uncharacterized protein YfbU (UPF0304 family)
MKLSSAERLLLSLNFRQLAEEEPAGGYDVKAEIIERGYTLLYPDVFGRTGEPELDDSVQREVGEILTMFRALHPGHEAGDDWNPDGDRYYQKFRGFDGNADTGHYGYARFLMEKTRRYEESQREYNSHSDTLDRYRLMLRRWNDLGSPHKVTQEQIDEIVK